MEKGDTKEVPFESALFKIPVWPGCACCTLVLVGPENARDKKRGMNYSVREKLVNLMKKHTVYSQCLYERLCRQSVFV